VKKHASAAFVATGWATLHPQLLRRTHWFVGDGTPTPHRRIRCSGSGNATPSHALHPGVFEKPEIDHFFNSPATPIGVAFGRIAAL